MENKRTFIIMAFMAVSASLAAENLRPQSTDTADSPALRIHDSTDGDNAKDAYGCVIMASDSQAPQTPPVPPDPPVPPVSPSKPSSKEATATIVTSSKGEQTLYINGDLDISQIKHIEVRKDGSGNKKIIINGNVQQLNENVTEPFLKKYTYERYRSVINITPDMLEMVSALNPDTGNDDLTALLKSITSMRVITYSGMGTSAMNTYIEAILDLIKNSPYKDMMKLNQNSNVTDIYVQKFPDGRIKRWLMLSYKYYLYITIVEIEGNMDMQTIAKALKTMNINTENAIPNAMKKTNGGR